VTYRQVSARFGAWKRSLSFAGEAAVSIVFLLVVMLVVAAWIDGLPIHDHVGDFLSGLALIVLAGLATTYRERRKRRQGTRLS
jgi:hypothetical protein